LDPQRKDLSRLLGGWHHVFRALSMLSLIGMAAGAGVLYFIAAALRIATNAACAYPLTAEHSLLNYLLLGSRCTSP
jgi:hypothetical protein